MPPVPARSAGDPPADATSSTTRHTKRADGPASVMAARSAVTTIGSAAPQVEGRPAPGRYLPVDHPGRAYLHHRTHEVSHMRAETAWPPVQPPGSGPR